MMDYKFVQCDNPNCNLRIPIDLDQFSGKYCPRCGSAMQVAAGSDTQKTGDKTVSEPKRSLVVILDNIRSAYNVGAIFRTAEGVGVKKLHLCGLTPVPNQSGAVAKTGLGAESLVKWEYWPNGLAAASELKDKGYNLVALERIENALLLNDYRPYPTDKPKIALILGNEKAGVDPGIIKLCDAVLSLPMMGKKVSLNVAVAFGAAAYWLSFI